jgi:hypothetical protein
VSVCLCVCVCVCVSLSPLVLQVSCASPLVQPSVLVSVSVSLCLRWSCVCVSVCLFVSVSLAGVMCQPARATVCACVCVCVSLSPLVLCLCVCVSLCPRWSCKRHSATCMSSCFFNCVCISYLFPLYFFSGDPEGFLREAAAAWLQRSSRGGFPSARRRLPWRPTATTWSSRRARSICRTMGCTAHWLGLSGRRSWA